MSENKMELWAKQAKEWKPMKPCEQLKKAIEAVKLHQEPGHAIPGRIVRAYAQKFGVEPDLIMLAFIDKENARPIKSLTIGEMAKKQGKDGKRARRFLRSGLDSTLDYNEQVKNPSIGKNGARKEKTI